MDTVITWTKVALGLGFVIFIHELGHFLLAKWNGVRVDRFSLGFGPPLLTYRPGVGLRVGTSTPPPGPDSPPSVGETDYWIAALPLGGYVKMLGEFGGPSDDEPRDTDPRSFNNKSVWGRMQIITAGVIMNLVLGVLCYTFIYTQGTIDAAAQVGSVQPGGPAYKAGLRAGDRIIALDGRREVGFSDFMQAVNTSGAGRPIRFTIRSLGTDSERDLLIEPVREGNAGVPRIGVSPASSLELFAKEPFRAPPGMTVPADRPTLGFEGSDKVVAVGPEGGTLEPVADAFAFDHRLAELRDRPLVVEVERLGKDAKAPPMRVKITVPPVRLIDVGLRMVAGPIVAVLPDSPAAKAGLRPGDRIAGVVGRDDYDPMRLAEVARASAGQPLKLHVVRANQAEHVGEVKLNEVEVLPIDMAPYPVWAGPQTAIDVAPLGLAMGVEATVRQVVPGSPAAAKGLKPNDIVRTMTLTPPKPKPGKKADRPVTLTFDGTHSSWPDAIVYLQKMRWESVTITINDKKNAPTTLNPVPVDRFVADRGLDFQPEMHPIPPVGVVEAVRRGSSKVVEVAYTVALTVRRLLEQRISAGNMRGLPGIANIAYDAANAGWIPFVDFLGSISINLAVLNFLPIPPLDGGQFLFLVGEKVRGKPLPSSFTNILTLGGVAFVLLLIVAINVKDVWSLFFS